MLDCFDDIGSIVKLDMFANIRHARKHNIITSMATDQFYLNIVHEAEGFLYFEELRHYLRLVGNQSLFIFSIERKRGLTRRLNFSGSASASSFRKRSSSARCFSLTTPFGFDFFVRGTLKR